MALDGIIFARAREEYARRADSRKLELNRRRADLYREKPELAELDAEIRGLMPQLAFVTLSGGEKVEEKIAELAKQSEALQTRRGRILKEMGFPEDWLEDKVCCQRCNDSGFAGGKPCECLMELYRAEQAKELSSLTHLNGESFDSFSLDWYGPEGSNNRELMEITYKFCRRYAETFGPGSDSLLFTGGSGLGKTFLSACIAGVVSKKGFSVVYQTAGEIFGAYESARFGGGEEQESARNSRSRLNSCDLLILDDLGTELTNSFTVASLYELVNNRLINGKKTIISTNLKPSELESRYSAQIASRLNGEYTAMSFYGEDIRLQKRRKQ